VSQSYNQRLTDTVHQLIWNNVIEKYIAKLMITVPVLGWPVIRDVVLYLADKYLVEPLLLFMVTLGVNLNIDSINAEAYKAYGLEARKMIGAQESGVWNPIDREEFRRAAKKLINITLRS